MKEDFFTCFISDREVNSAIRTGTLAKRQAKCHPKRMSKRLDKYKNKLKAKYDQSRHASLKALTRSFSGVVLTPE